MVGQFIFRPGLELPGSIITTHQFDAALITLDRPLRFNKFVQPICLPEKGKELPSGTEVTVSGFGRMKRGGQTAEFLQHVVIPVQIENCYQGTSEHSREDLSSKITDDMLCAGYSGKGVCHGDSGAWTRAPQIVQAGALPAQDRELFTVVEN